MRLTEIGELTTTGAALMAHSFGAAEAEALTGTSERC